MGAKSVVFKSEQDSHYPKDFGGGTISLRQILPSKDGTEIAVTKFLPKGGFTPGYDIVHVFPELVIVLQGQIMVSSEGVTRTLGPEAMYYVPARTPTTFTALKDSRV